MLVKLRSITSAGAATLACSISNLHNCVKYANWMKLEAEPSFTRIQVLTKRRTQFVHKNILLYVAFIVNQRT